ncbi:major facilitator superfamily mfs_1, putative [Ichthyophthirius multifiliis]|uniref:Major facilitator superfamily mfs_1, putative n=1 Tax=Ichthyophthirius multifiliis TaxID=5932 RepID=G0QNH6_ICHMU|nr:major facilitator superfamily mfs_1, putative [Ichthyophthirius multifiliis]EGR33238.1 major facilitator superfamily mfs_1, putative [Ichthyophthirius multifiliis]|eukprot:XP_004037224.1 major facilitator superfamily mfs_1, putative [Ichthyophthirius multifiliis]
MSQQDQINYDSNLNTNLVLNKDNNKQYTFFWNLIFLEQGITKLNYVALLLNYFLLTLIFVTTESLQPMLFQDKFQIKQENQGSENANLLLADIIIKILFAPIMGIICDKVGRKYTLFYGILIISISLALMPLSTSIYPMYLLLRILYAHGSITICIVPIFADYVQNITKGKGAAINVVFASLGAVSSVEIINNGLRNQLSIKQIYWVIAFSYFCLGCMMCIYIKNGKYYLDNTKDKKNDMVQIIKIGIQSAKNPMIFIGYLTSFLARGDSILFTLFLVLWSNKYIPDYNQANIKAATLSGIAYTIILFFCIFYGIAMERYCKYKVHITMFLLASIGCFMLNFADKGPNSWISYLAISILGVGMSGFLTSSQYLINKYADNNNRGYINGLASLIGVLGIFVCSVIGGYIYDKLGSVNIILFFILYNIFNKQNITFMLFGIMSIIAIILLFITWYINKDKNFENDNDEVQQISNSTQINGEQNQIRV